MQKIKCTLVHIKNDESLTPQIKYIHYVVESVDYEFLVSNPVIYLSNQCQVTEYYGKRGYTHTVHTVLYSD